VLTILATVVGVLGGLVGLSQLVLRWRAHRVDDVREVTDLMRTMFGDVIAHGEVPAGEFMTAEARANETRMKDLIQQVRDRKLKDRLGKLLSSWLETFANAPPTRIGVSMGRDDGSATIGVDSPERRAQVKRQVQAARDGQDTADAVKTRCNRFERFIVSR
jgi:hypothetical protein